MNSLIVNNIECVQSTNEYVTHLFFCDSHMSYQKGMIKRNHEFISYIPLKRITFNNLTKKNIIDMQNHINNVKRKSLNYQTPYLIFLKQYGDEITKNIKNLFGMQ